MTRMAKAPAFQFYPKDYETDEAVKMMSLEQEGAFLRLLCHSWLHGSIPSEIAAQAVICRVPARKMAKLWPGVAPCFEPAGKGRLVNPRLERGRAEQEAHHRERVEAGRRGGTSTARKVAELQAEPQQSSSSLASAELKPSSASATASATPENERQFVTGSENGNGHLTDEQRQEYADAVWSKFLEQAGHAETRIASPTEFAVLSGWMDSGIPLRIVLRGIEDTKGKGSSLAYYANSVRDAFAYWRKAIA